MFQMFLVMFPNICVQKAALLLESCTEATYGEKQVRAGFAFLLAVVYVHLPAFCVNVGGLGTSEEPVN